MTEKAHPKGGGQKVPRTAKTGSLVIVNASKQARSKTLVSELARAGVYVVVPKGAVHSTRLIEKKIRNAIKNTGASIKVTAKRTEPEQVRARLVGPGLTRAVKKGDLPWATDAEIHSSIDMADTLSSDEIAKRLNTNRETISQWRAAGRLLGVEGAKRGVRYPTAQIGKNLAPLDGIKEVIEALGGDCWETWRFLAGEIDELEGKTGFEVLRSGCKDDLLEVIEAKAYGSFS